VFPYAAAAGAAAAPLAAAGVVFFVLLAVVIGIVAAIKVFSPTARDEMQAERTTVYAAPPDLSTYTDSSGLLKITQTLIQATLPEVTSTDAFRRGFPASHSRATEATIDPLDTYLTEGPSRRPETRQLESGLAAQSAKVRLEEASYLAGMRLDAETFGWMTAQLTQAAEKSARGRIALLLEGGYDLPALERSLAASVRVLGGGAAQRPEGAPSLEHDAEIRRAEKELAPYWPLG
jgi:hypothetical protein